MSPTPRPKSKKRAIRFWCVCVMKSGSVERCAGTRLRDDGHLIEVYDEGVLNLSVQKSEILDRWEQERRITKVVEQRVKEALLRIPVAALGATGGR